MPLTVEDLRGELKSFAEEFLKGELANMACTIATDLHQKLIENPVSNHKAFSKSRTVSARNLRVPCQKHKSGPRLARPNGHATEAVPELRSPVSIPGTVVHGMPSPLAGTTDAEASAHAHESESDSDEIEIVAVPKESGTGCRNSKPASAWLADVELGRRHFRRVQAQTEDKLMPFTQKGFASDRQDPKHQPQDQSVPVGEVGGNTELQADYVHVVPKPPSNVRSAQVDKRESMRIDRLRLSSHSTRIETSSDALPQRGQVEALLGHRYFEYASMSVIVLFAAYTGLTAEYQAGHLQEGISFFLIILDWSFCSIITFEVLLRLYGTREYYLRQSGWQLNVFDLVLVSLQILQLVMSYLLWRAVPSPHLELYNLRLIRLIRLVASVRSLKVMRFIGLARTIAWSTVSSLKPLCGALAVLSLTCYVNAIFFFEVVSSHRRNMGPQDEHYAELGNHFGSLSQCMLTLYASIAGGLDWAVVLGPLMSISPSLGLAFCTFVAFCVLALLNTITGVFVEHALEVGKKDRDRYTLKYFRRLFERIDGDGDGCITWDDFKHAMEHDDMAELFQSVEIDSSEAQYVFRLIDIDNSGIIDADTFLNGCFRLRGQATALDMLVMMHENRCLFNTVIGKMKSMDRVLRSLGTDFDDHPGGSPSVTPKPSN